jgi:antagonist of KipI
MPSFEIIKPGLLTTIQDAGRKGLAYYAIPPSGAMDRNAARIALLLLNLAEEAPLIECTSVAPTIKFHDATQIAISGADFQWTLNDSPVGLHAVVDIQPGDILRGKMATNGLRGYIAINGNLQVDKVYNSYATYPNAGIGGYKGRMLKKGDILEWESNKEEDYAANTIPLLPGPEFSLLTEASQRQLQDITYTIGSDSNRMGLRLRGKRLESASYQLEYSLPVLPGFVQLPPSGLPIILLQDGQISGGYPRIAYLRERHLAVLNQIPLGGEVRFRTLLA